MLIAIVLIAAIAFKIFDSRGLRTVLRELGLAQRMVGPGVAAVISLELIIAVLLLAAPPVPAGLATVLLFLGFASVVFLRRNQASGCGCMGRVSRSHGSLAAEELPRIAGAAGGILIVIEGSASGWFNETSAGLALAVVAAYAALVAVRRVVSLEAETTPAVATATAFPAVDFGSPLPVVRPVEPSGVERRHFLAALAGAPAALLIPNAGSAAELRHCTTGGCAPDERCFCCYHADENLPTCACYPEDAPLQPPQCRPICCNEWCCQLQHYMCGSDCAFDFEACARRCETLCGTDASCSLCYASCSIGRTACDVGCDWAYFVCGTAASLCSPSEAPAATPAGAAR